MRCFDTIFKYSLRFWATPFYSPMWLQRERSTTTLRSVVSFVFSRSGPEHDSLDRNLIIDKKCVTRNLMLFKPLL